MINSMMLHLFQDNARIRQLTEVLKICYHTTFVAQFEHGFIQIRFGIIEIFTRYHFY